MIEPPRRSRADLAAVVERMARASSRPKQPWIEVLEAAGRIRDGRSTFSSLGSWDPLRDLPAYDGRAREPRSTLGLDRAITLASVGIDLETILRDGLPKLAATLPTDHPAHRYIGHELTEEAEHSAMFDWFRNAVGPDRPRHSSIDEDESRRIANLGATNPPAFLLYVICGELIFDRVQRATLVAPDTPPIVAAMNRIHCVEEARHLSFGESLLAAFLAAGDRKVMRQLTYEAPTVARWTSARVINMPLSLHRAVGASDDDLAEAQAVVRRSPLHRRAIRDVHAVCRRLGLDDDRLRGAWARETGEED